MLLFVAGKAARRQGSLPKQKPKAGIAGVKDSQLNAGMTVETVAGRRGRQSPQLGK
jgi:hypothetical protein